MIEIGDLPQRLRPAPSTVLFSSVSHDRRRRRSLGSKPRTRHLPVVLQQVRTGQHRTGERSMVDWSFEATKVIHSGKAMMIHAQEQHEVVEEGHGRGDSRPSVVHPLLDEAELHDGEQR